MFDLLKSLSVALKYVVGFGCLQRLPAAAPDRSDVPEYDAGKCVGCKLCARACPAKAIFVSTVRTKDGWRVEKFKLDAEKCAQCVLCVEACPKGALSVKGEKECL